MSESLSRVEQPTALEPIVGWQRETIGSQGVLGASYVELHDAHVAAVARLRVAEEALQQITPEALEKFMVPTDNYSDEWRCAVYECGEWMRERIAAALGSVGVGDK